MTSLFIPLGLPYRSNPGAGPTIYSNDDDSVIYDGAYGRYGQSTVGLGIGNFRRSHAGLRACTGTGGQTFGKGTVQTMIPLNRRPMKLTAAKFYRVSGQSTQNQGVIPDIEFPSLFDQDAIGEPLDGAMPWDVIDAARYHPSSELSPHIFDLQTRHLHRTKNDPHQPLSSADAQSRRKIRELTCL